MQESIIDEGELSNLETTRLVKIRDAERRVLGPGKVYQGVSRSIRWLLASGAQSKDEDGNPRHPVIDADEHAGTIAAARSLAAVIDRMSGHNPTGWTANGRDLGPLHEQLIAHLTELRADVPGADPFTELLTELQSNDPSHPLP